MTEEIITSCPICNGRDLQDTFKTKDYTYSNKLFQLTKCNTCSLIITSPRPDKNNIVNYYESINYISHTTKSKTLFDTFYFIARKFALKNKKKLIHRYNSDGKLLDIGCGTGSFLKYMRKDKWDTYGVEPSDKAKKIAQGSENKIFENIQEIKDSKFIVITLWHVLEHIHDLNDTVIKIREHLEPNGTLFIAVPNYESYDCKHYESNWAAYDVPRHLWHFSKKSMEELLNKHQLKLIAIEPMKMDSFYVSLLSEKNSYPKTSALIRTLRALIIGLISNLKASKSTNYSSLIYIVKKS